MKNKIPIEKFISDNKKLFDTLEPSQQLKNNIFNNSLKKNHRHPPKFLFIQKNYMHWSVSAAMILIAVSITWFISKPSNQSDLIQSKNLQQASILTSIPKEYFKEISNFINLISNKQEKINIYQEQIPMLCQQFKTDLSALDSSYKTLLQDLVEKPNKEIVINAIINNLQLQIQILNTQLSIIKELEQDNSLTNEKDAKKI